MKKSMTIIFITISMLFSAAIFGFFYAWVCSTMWGLDATDPRVAIKAMQAMNASVRNAIFAPAFFGTPIMLGITSFILWLQRKKTSSIFFGLSAFIYLVFGAGLTMAINVPMNEALALQKIPQDTEVARQIWNNYSKPWQFWNQMRTIASGLSFVLAICGLVSFSRANNQ